MLTLYGIANCDKIRATRRWLKENNVDHRFHDFRKDGCPAGLAAEILDALGEDIAINRRGTTWRGLPEDSKRDLDRAGMVRLMCDNPALIKRPLLQRDSRWLLAAKPADIRPLLNDH